MEVRKVIRGHSGSTREDFKRDQIENAGGMKRGKNNGTGKVKWG